MGLGVKEEARHMVEWRVEKYIAKDGREIAEKGLKPYEVVTLRHNCLLHEGISTLLGLLCGIGSETPYSNANARIGVGDSSTAPADTQTGLLGSNKFWKGMNAGYPQKSGDHDIVFQADFNSGEAEFAWNEQTIVNAANDSGSNLCRQNTALGTKPAGQTWRLTGTITFT
ncbi:MAG: hypothetical protein QXL10_00920 [Candidatus Bathyarchaeia archaeon]